MDKMCIRDRLEMDVYNYIISNEEKVVYMKVRELAEEVHVSTTTILRFCKKVGCEGYSEFRLKLKQEVNSKEQKKINMDLTAVKDFFERVQTQAFAENIQEAVKLLTKASSIIFVGVGNSSFIGKYGARYFNNVGWFSFAIDAVSYTHLDVYKRQISLSAASSATIVTSLCN